MSKPTNKPGWTSVSNPSSEPTSKKLTGWSAGEKPSAEHMNWLFKNISEWINHIDVDRVKGETGDQGPQGDVGPQGSAGSGSLSAADEARIAALEAKVVPSASSSVTMPLSYQGSGVASEYNAGNSGSAITIDWSNGVSQAVTVNDNTTISFANPTSGKVYYLRLKSDGLANRNLTFVGAVFGVSSIANRRTILFSLYWDGSAYVVQKIDSFFAFVSGPETKSGYIAGGVVGNGTTIVNSGTVDKLNFNSDQTISTIHTTFGRTLDITGIYVYPTVIWASVSVRLSQGTQSSTHGYRLYGVYPTLPTINSQSTNASHKLAFANDTDGIVTLRLSSNMTSPLATNNLQTAAVQSSENAYILRTTTTFGTTYNSAKLQFSTDIGSNISVSGVQLTSNTTINSSHGISGSTSGIFWGVLAGTAPGVSGRKMEFSNETAVTTTTYSLPVAAGAESRSEAIDGQLKGYYIRGTGTSAVPTTTAYVTDKSVETWNTLTSVLSQAGSGSAATQGVNAGYFCGHYNGSGIQQTTQGPPPSAISSSQIKKMEFNSDVFSVHGASLNQAKHVACGFEG
jgi:hypothetical protein